MQRVGLWLKFGVLAASLVSLPACGDDDQPSADSGTGSGTETDSSGSHSNHTTGDSGGTASNSGESSTGTDDTNTNWTTTSTGTTDSGSSDGSDSATSGTDTNTDGSTGTDDNTGTDTVPDEQEAVRALAGAICNWGESCCDSNELGFIFGPFVEDAANCTDRLVQLVNSSDNNPPSEIHLGELESLVYDLAFHVDLTRSEPIPGAVEACVQWWQEKGCNEAKDITHCEATDNPCELHKLFTGTVENGGKCSGQLAQGDRVPYHADIECVTGTTCESIGQNGSVDFRCVGKGVEGDFCNPNDADNDHASACEHSFYCHEATGTCRARPTLGESCQYDDLSTPAAGSEVVPCEENLTCDPVSNRCVAQCSVGDRCQSPNELGLDYWMAVTANVTPGQFDRFYEKFVKNSDIAQCPTGASCAPYVKPDGTASDLYSFCRAPQKPGKFCDTHMDCQPGYHCDADYFGRDEEARNGEGEWTFARAIGVCQADHREGVKDKCHSNPWLGEQCAEGLFCDDLHSTVENDRPGTCQRWLPIDSECIDHRECNPVTTFGCLPYPEEGYPEYAAARVDEGDDEKHYQIAGRCAAREQKIGEKCIVNGGYWTGWDELWHIPSPFKRHQNFCETGVCLPDRTADGEPVHVGWVGGWSPGCYNEFLSCLSHADSESAAEKCVKKFESCGLYLGTCDFGSIEGTPCSDDFDEYMRTGIAECAPDLQCTKGVCRKFLEPGQACEPSKTITHDLLCDPTILPGIEDMLDPFIADEAWSQGCVGIWGDHYCGLNQDTRHKVYCDNPVKPE